LSNIRFRGRLAGVMAILATAFVAPFVATTPAHASGITMSILQFNMCGHACGTGLTVAHDVESSINGHSPQPSIVTLEEVCRSQYNDIYGTLVPYYGHFITTVAGACGGGDDYGIAVLVKTSSYTYLGDWALPATSGEARRMGCLQTSAFNGSQPVVACVTHITTVGADIPGQVAFVATKMQGFYSGHHVIIGGDLNTTPGTSAMSKMYDSHNSPAGTGIFAEADLPYNGNRNSGSDGSTYNEYTSCGGQHYGCGGAQFWSATNKIDYIFLGSGDWTNYSADSTSATHSDHKPLWATATLA
jgi:endonuclease/exonuclease/phosphatase family metal-dependent hydrolase